MHDLVIIGAGPYGLGTAAQAKQAGLDYLLIGEPMKFWKESMPGFMVVRSPFVASSLYSPQQGLGLEDFYRETGRTANKREKISLKIYLKYVDWFLAKADLNIKAADALQIKRDATGIYQIALSDGQSVQAKGVVMAVGNPPFATIPEVVKSVDRAHYSHTSEVPDFSRFAGKRVLVVGAGQSAIEACLGLLQVGAQTLLSHRQDAIYWHNIPLRINVPLLLFFLSFPTVLENVPYALRKALGDKVSQPTVDTWLRPKIESKVNEYARSEIEQVEEVADGVQVRFADGRAVTVDHIILGTGYEVDIAHLPVWDKALAAQLAVRDGYPVIDKHLESNVPGLFFNGVPAKGRFGPTFNFIFASPAGARRVIEGVKARLAGH